MSAISSTGSSLNELLQQLQQQQLNAGQRAPGSFQGNFGADFTQAVQAAGVDPTKAQDLLEQVQKATTQAQATDGSAADKRAATKAAVDNVLTQNGVDITKFREALQKSHGAHRTHGGHKGGRSGASGPRTDAAGVPAPSTGNASTAAVDGLGATLDVAA